jgi:2',3'-cyclic-nucleotide 2'-phosphodiesterase
VFIERQPRLVRPANYPPGTPGRGAAVVENAEGARLLIVNLLGRIFMEALDDPFAALDRELQGRDGCQAVVVDVHAEATSEKWALGHFAAGRASLVVGTHTHVPSADHRILAGGTGFVTDVGMTGDYDSVIGMEKDEPLRRFTRRIPSGRFEPAVGPATLCAVAAELDGDGRTTAIAPVRIGGLLNAAEPDFWA